MDKHKEKWEFNFLAGIMASIFLPLILYFTNVYQLMTHGVMMGLSITMHFLLFFCLAGLFKVKYSPGRREFIIYASAILILAIGSIFLSFHWPFPFRGKILAIACLVVIGLWIYRLIKSN